MCRRFVCSSAREGLGTGDIEGSTCADANTLANLCSTIRVETCDWVREKVPQGSVQYVVCCECLYAGRDVWPGLVSVLQQLSDVSANPEFREVLLAVNLRVGRKDIDDFLGMLAAGGAEGGEGVWIIEKIFDNYGNAASCRGEWRAGIGEETVEKDDGTTIEERLLVHRRKVELGRHAGDAGELLSDDERGALPSAERRKAQKRAAKAPKKAAAPKNGGRENKSLTNFGIEIYSFRRRWGLRGEC